MVKHYLVAAVVAVLLLLLLQFALGNLLGAKTASVLKRDIADVRSTVEALEDYRADHGEYPRGFSPEELESALEPEYLRNVPGIQYRQLSYYSDGANYALILRAGGSAPIELRNGEFVSWPAEISPDKISADAQYFRDRMRQVDKALQSQGNRRTVLGS